MFDVDLKKTAPNMRDLVSYTGLGCWGLGVLRGLFIGSGQDFLHLCWSPDSKNIALSNRREPSSDQPPGATWSFSRSWQAMTRFTF